MDLFEVEISQIHVAVRQDVNGKDILPFNESNFEKLRSQVPVVPLTPSQWFRGIIGSRDLQRSRRVLSIYIH